MTKAQQNALYIVVGLGKTGLSSVRYLATHGYGVSVVDTRENPPGADELKKEFPDINCYFGGLHAEILVNANTLVVSPGVSVQEPEIVAAAKNGAKIIGDIELFVREAKAPIVAITGSNGKSSVTTLVGEMAKAANLTVGVGGNLGEPALNLLAINKPDLYVLELSSFQLETTYSLRAAAATILNITPDHLDRYESFAYYKAAKLRIYNNCRQAIVNKDDTISPKNEIKKIFFSLNEPKKDEFGLIAGFIAFADKKLIAAVELKIKGQHQILNALAACALSYAVNIPFSAMIEGLRNYPGLPHRCQFVAKIAGVDWYNDSKGTNVGATEAAILGLSKDSERELILIAGGQGKNQDFSLLYDVVKKHVRDLILIGEDAAIISKALDGAAHTVFADSMRDAVYQAKSIANAHDIVLLSPACASFDMFRNYEHRGDEFIREVENGID